MIREKIGERQWRQGISALPVAILGNITISHIICLIYLTPVQMHRQKRFSRFKLRTFPEALPIFCPLPAGRLR